MNKAEFAALLSKKTNLSKSKCEMVLKQFKEAVLEVCSKGDQVILRDFGKFYMTERKARKFLNPQTKRYYICSPKKLITFKSYANTSS